MLTPGSQLGRYTVSERLGAGGMGDVYLALDPLLDRQVAVKVLPETLASDADRFARFLREAKAVSALNHPNILIVFDFGTHGATPYLVSEYVDGRTLREWSAETRPPLVDLLDAMVQAATALAAAHEAGIVHRDVKPENLMRRRDGFVKVLDFGIAKLVTSATGDAAVDAHTDPSRQTMPGTILGTTRYMSPEQAMGTAVDARSDVWSLGAVLYELVAGKPPFDAPTPMGTLAMIVGREPEALDCAAPGTPEVVCQAVTRALRKQPGERFATAAEMAAELARAARELRGETGHGEAVTQPLDRAVRVTDATVQSPTNLPPRASALVGRERELGEVLALLQSPGVRLVTLVGPGGTGKTRLAVEAGRELAGDFADGVFAVDLSTISDPAQILSHVAEVFRLKESADRSLAAELERHLSDKRMLLVLDSFEHLLPGAPFVSTLLASAPGLEVLVTSRASLHLSAEREYTVEPLAVPAFTSLPPVDELARTPAVALFVERARQAKPSFELTTDNARSVVEICRRLDGLPLALELAAARVRVLAPAAVLERLENGLKLLTGGARDLPSRQQTMRGAVAWSYDLLDEDERVLLRRLSVFVGGCTFEAAEQVCGSDDVDVLDTITSLVDKSLLRQRELPNGEARFTMLEVVREYALEQLEAAGEAGDARLEHARCFRRLAEEASQKLNIADQLVWVEQLTREIDNIKAALAVMLEREPHEGALFAVSMAAFWLAKGRHSERRRWHTRALGVETLAPQLRARLLVGLSSTMLVLGDTDAAVVHAREGVEAARASGEPVRLASTLTALAAALERAGDLDGARAVYEEGLPIVREFGDRRMLGAFIGNIGELARMGGDLATARAYCKEGLDALGRHARSQYHVIPLANLGCLSLEEGDFAAAEGLYRESLSIAAELEDPTSVATALDGLAAVAIAVGDGEHAAWLAGAAEALYETEGLPLEPLEKALRDRYVAALRAALDAETLEREWARGRQMSLGEAASAALGA